jgi:hypothetical protein
MHATLNRAGLIAAVAAAAVGLSVTADVFASSHREAPMITEMPKVDGTDVYAFRSYEPGRSGFVTLIANYLPLQDAYGGPNYFNLDPDAFYEIHVDNNGDGREDLTFQFNFRRSTKNISLDVGGRKVAIPLINSGGIADVNPATLNVSESYTIDMVRGSRRVSRLFPVVNAAGGTREFQKPVDNIGNKSIPDYAGYAARHVYNVLLPDCPTQGRVFVGQRREGFGVNLGEIFDLVNLSVPRVIGSRSGAGNATEYKNVTSIAMELPIACLTTPGEPVIGVWSTASLPRSRILAGLTSALNVERNMMQVSRLGMPLVNELVIGLKDKDAFNMSEPRDDGQFATYVTNPTLPALLGLLFADAGVQAPSVFPRSDLVAAFLTGVPGVNQPRNVVPSEMIRLNTAIPVTAKGAQNSLGAAQCFVQGALVLTNPGCDPAGFPNGRRPGDDVVDIELRVAMGFLLPPGPGKPASADLPYTDGVLVNDSLFDAAFPYLRTPVPGSPNGANGIAPNAP